MSDIKPNDFRKHAAEDEFFRLAAMEIESEQNEEFLEAQNLPDPSPEVLAQIQKSLQTTMHQARKQTYRHTIFLHLGRFTACAALVCCIFFSGTYFGVEAARDTINNFVLELFDDHAILRTEVSKPQEGAVLPTGWQGPFYVTWIPTIFTNVKSSALNFSWALRYTSEDSLKNMSIFVWVASHAPSIDIEGTASVEQTEIQNSTANIYLKPDKGVCTLLWAKSDYIIMITGNISSEDAKKIAENIIF